MKAGTTALADFLDQHPEICIAVPKQSGYFASDLMQESDTFHQGRVYFKTRSLDDYEKLYAPGSEALLRGDASTAYIYSREAAHNIYQYNPKAKIIILIRKPADFCHALHRQYLNETVEDEQDFEKALALEEERKQGRSIPKRVRVPSYLYYSERIKYYRQVKRYLDIFPRYQVLILLHEEFQNNNSEVFHQVLRFIEVRDTGFISVFDSVNVSGEPRLSWLHNRIHYSPFKNMLYKLLGGRLYTWFHKTLSSLLIRKSPRDELSTATRKRLNSQAELELGLLSEVLGVDLVKKWANDD